MHEVILIVMIGLGVTSSGGATLHTQEFNSMKHCEEAKQLIITRHEKADFGGSIVAECVYK